MSDLLVERHSGVIFVTLNRPESLNALNFSIVRGLNAVLDTAASDADVHAVCIAGAGERAFCAGGDIKAARDRGLEWKAGQGDLDGVLQFFKEEYALNRRMFYFSKPLIALMNGITMGGGVGIAGACRYRIATEKILWAMPEVSIGFFPDVGAGYYLTGAPGCAGRYFALTGQPISNVADLLSCGFITHFVPANQISSLVQSFASNKTLDNTIGEYAQPPNLPAALDYEAIDKHFCEETIEAILGSLEGGNEWAKETAKHIRTKSPTSLKITLKHLQLSVDDQFETVSLRDEHLARQFLRGVDLYEGIRAAVVDKDRQPKWNPCRLEDVNDAILADYFSLFLARPPHVPAAQQ